MEQQLNPDRPHRFLRQFVPENIKKERCLKFSNKR